MFENYCGSLVLSLICLSKMNWTFYSCETAVLEVRQSLTIAKFLSFKLLESVFFSWIGDLLAGSPAVVENIKV